MPIPVRTAVAAVTLFAGLLAPAAIAAAEPVALTPAPTQQQTTAVAGTAGTGSFSPSQSGSASDCPELGGPPMCGA